MLVYSLVSICLQEMLTKSRGTLSSLLSDLEKSLSQPSSSSRSSDVKVKAESGQDVKIKTEPKDVINGKS